MKPPLETLIKQKFGLHRGLYSELSEENSLPAIKKAVDLEPLWVEFDVMLENNRELRTGHPPQASDKFENVLSLFKEKKAFPKIDLKLQEEKKSRLCFYMIDKTLDLINFYEVGFALISITGERKYIIETQHYLFQKIKNNSKIKLNVDLAKYQETGKRLEEIERHVENIKDIIHSLSPEIHKDNWDENAQFAEKYQIKNLQFWLRGWPDQPDPRVAKETIYQALDLEKKYNIKVSFDINPQYIY